MNGTDSLQEPDLLNNSPRTGRGPAVQRKILFVVPYKARDLDGLALIGYHLRSRYGHQVEFSNGYRIEHKILKHAPDAIVLDHLVWDFKARQAQLAKRLGMKVVVLPTEGFHKDKEEAVRIAGKLTRTSQMVDCHFAWGDFVRDAVLEQRLTTAEQIHTVGCPRFDFYSEPYLSLMRPRAEFLSQLGIKNTEAPVILWTTSTTYAWRNQQKMFRRHVTKGNLPAAEVRAYLEDGRNQFQTHSRLVIELARRHPDWNFIIKVHPAEWINPYVALARDVPNVHLAFDAPIREFLYHCDVLLQRGCTTGTEAWMLNKPVLELEVGRYQLAPPTDYVEGNHVVFSVDEADTAIREYLAGVEIGPAQQAARAAFIRNVYYRIDGRSSERCAKIIDRVLTPPNYTDEDQARTAAAVAAAYADWQEQEDLRLPNRLKDLLGIRRDVSLRIWKRITREAKDNLGLFIAEPEITANMVLKLYARYDSL